jgi:hypothetical protein
MLDSYLSQLEAKLRQALPRDIAEEHSREIGAHLRDSIAERIVAGEDENVAIEAALQHIGSEALVADGLIYAHTGFAKKSVWRIAWVPALILFAFWFMPIIANPLMSSNGVFQAWVIGVPTAFLGIFCFTCLKTRRFVMAPIGAAMAVLLIALVVQDRLSYLSAKPAYANYAQASDSLQRAERIQNRLSAVTVLNAEWTSKSPSKVPGSLMAPVRFAHSTLGSNGKRSLTPGFRVVLTHSATEARALWKQNGHDYMRELNIALVAEQQNPAVGLITGMPPIWPSLIAWTEGLSGTWLVLGALNLIVLGLNRLRREIVSRRWRPVSLV